MAERTIKIRFDGTATGLQKAAKVASKELDKFGQDAKRSMGDAGDSSGGSFFRRFQRKVSGLAVNGMVSVASAMGSGLARGVQANPWIGAAIVAALAAVVVVTMPALGSLMAGALITGFGAAIGGIGLVFAAQAERVQNRFTELKDGVVADLKEMAKPLEDVWLAFADQAQSAFDFLAPALGDAFESMAPHLENFFGAFFEGLKAFEPAIAPITEAFNALTDAIGEQLPVWMGQISDALIEIANTVKDNPEAFADIIGFFIAAAVTVLQVINKLAELYTWFTVTLPQGVEDFRVWVVTKFAELTESVGGFFKRVGDAGTSAFRWIRDRATDAKNWVVARFNDVVGFFRGLPGRIGSAASGMWDGLKSSFRSAVNWIIGKWNNLSLTIGGGSILGVGIPSVTLNTPDIPRLASGGAAREGRSYLVGENGPELFTPRNSGTVAPNHALGATEVRVFIGDREISDIVRTEIRESNRGIRRAVLAGVGGAR
jgi:phage-related protein